jgi:hypothetical protein
MMAETGGYAERFGSSVMLNWALLDNVANAFFGIDADANVKASSTVSDNGLDKGKNYDKTGKSNTLETQDSNDKAEKELRQKVITVMRKLPTYLFLESKKIDNVNDIIRNNNHSLFKDTVGIDLTSFEKLCVGFIKVDRLDRAIMAYNQIESMQ